MGEHSVVLTVVLRAPSVALVVSGVSVLHAPSVVLVVSGLQV
jgi:hypothetical protein